MSEVHPHQLPALLFIHAETPLHAGAGDGLGAIDLPLQRERITEVPLVQGSGVKGSLRESYRRADGEEEDDLFGPPQGVAEGPRAHEFAGALALTDARVLLLPVRSARGAWAWITCPMVLQRFERDLAFFSRAPHWGGLLVGEAEALVGAAARQAIAPQGKLVLEDAGYSAKVETKVEALAKFLVEAAFPTSGPYEPFRKRLAGQLAVVADEEFRHWARHGTEVTTRVRIDETTGTVAKGALWTEEALPAETVLWSLALVSDSFRPGATGRAEALRTRFVEHCERRGHIFLGGDRSTGRGLVALRALKEVARG